MNAIAGWLGQTTDPLAALERQAAACGTAGAEHASGPGWAVAASGRVTSLWRADTRACAIVGHPRFASAPQQARAAEQGFARIFAERFAERGRQALEELKGDFALAYADGARDELLLAVDRLGVQPLAFALTPQAVVFGSSAGAVVAHPAVSRELSAQALYNYIYFHMVPGPDTAYAGVSRLLPGEYLHASGGRRERGRYWEMRYEEDGSAPFETLKQEFIGTLTEAVRRAADNGSVGSFLSGGTDSSTISGLLGRVTGEPARTFSIGFEAEGYDEMEYARLAARHFCTRHTEYYVTPEDVVAAVPKIAAAYDEPFGNASAVPTYYCAKLARDAGIERLLGGDGGDELFGGNSRYATQRLFSLYDTLPSWLRGGLIEPALGLPGMDRIPPLRKAQSYVRQAKVPMPQRYESYNLLERLGPAHVFTDDFLARIEQGRPMAMMVDTYRSAHARSLVNRMLALDLKFTLADNDLPKVSRTCSLAGVDVRYPLLDDAVLDFSARLAPELKLKGFKLRWFFKEALRDFLPPEIIVKKKHGFGLPFGVWLQTHPGLQGLARDSLEGLRSRGIVRSEFIDELTSKHLVSHAGYYGTLVWVLMMLEQWFRQHADTA